MVTQIWAMLGCMTNRLVGRAAIAALALTLLGAACGGDDNSSSSTEPTTTVEATTTTSSLEALCAARDQLTSSVEGLASADVLKNGTASLSTALDEVKSNLQAVKSAASEELKPEVDDFQAKLQALQDAIGNAGSGGVGQIVTAASAAARSGSTLVTSLKNTSCDGEPGS